MLSISCALSVMMTFAVVHGDPTAKVIIEDINIKVNDNPFFGTWTAILHPSGEKLSLKTPIKQDFPPNMMMKLEILLGGNELPDFEMSLCDAFKDETVGKGLIEHGIPKGAFPQDCPIKAGANLEIKDWEFPSDKVPPGIPDSPINGVVTMYEAGKAPILTMTTKGKLMHKIPGIGR